MPSLYEPARRQELLDRVGRLQPDRPPKWGRFTAPKMVNHLIESMRMARGEITPRSRTLPLTFILRPLLIHARWLPWPKSSPTAPELLTRVPASWEADVATLHDLLATHPAHAEGEQVRTHPAFGQMSSRDWGALIYRHVDHHLTQFDC